MDSIARDQYRAAGAVVDVIDYPPASYARPIGDTVMTAVVMTRPAPLDALSGLPAALRLRRLEEFKAMAASMETVRRHLEYVGVRARIVTHPLTPLVDDTTNALLPPLGWSRFLATLTNPLVLVVQVPQCGPVAGARPGAVCQVEMVLIDQSRKAVIGDCLSHAALPGAGFAEALGRNVQACLDVVGRAGDKKIGDPLLHLEDGSGGPTRVLVDGGVFELPDRWMRTRDVGITARYGNDATMTVTSVGYYVPVVDDPTSRPTPTGPWTPRVKSSKAEDGLNVHATLKVPSLDKERTLVVDCKGVSSEELCLEWFKRFTAWPR